MSPPAKVFLFCAGAYVCLVFGAWTAYLLTLYPVVSGVGNMPARILLNESIRVLIFVAPVFLFLKYAIGVKPISFLKLDANVKTGILWGIAAGAGYALLVLGRILAVNGSFNPKPVPAEAWFTALTVATLIEEIAFRGFLQQTLERATNLRAALFSTAIIFVAVHFPGWIIIADAALLPDKMTAMAEIFFLGLLLGWLFKKTQSLLAGVILHAANNLLSTVFFG